MSLENEDRRFLDNGSEYIDTLAMKTKISYSREFLLSLSNLDSCKKLPSGFDESLISELEDALLRIPDRPRIFGSLPSKGFRRNDYGSSTPAQVDSGRYSRGIYGKWESHSSGWGDRDGDSQSDRDSDSGRRYGHQSRRSWQTSEHDGLLGSGSFPRPSGYAAGTSAPKVRANEQNQLSRSSEPYHPPWPYKAVPHSRRDTDSYNDETFGSIDSTSEDRAEEERRRKASFETMRKEQHKALREKQKLNLEKYKAGDVSGLCEMLIDRKEEKGLLSRNNELVGSAASSFSSNDLEKSSFASQSPALRPLVPPGFTGNTLEKGPGLRSLVHPPLSELGSMGTAVTGECLMDTEANLFQNTTDGLERRRSQEINVVDGQPVEKTQHVLLLNQGENGNVNASLDVPIEKPFMEDQLVHLSSHLESHATLDASEITELGTKGLEGKTVSNGSSTSLLEKIFGSSPSLNDGLSGLAENLDGKPDDAWSISSAHSSKFAHWFFVEEAKVADDVTSARPNDLLSLIATGDKANVLSDQSCINKEQAFPTVLTCEDLEQSILSEYSSKVAEIQSDLRSGGNTVANAEPPSLHVDNHASLHLLSMLQKSTDNSNATVNSGVDINWADEGPVSVEHDMATALNEPKGHENSNTLPNLGKTLTLETLFGTAFMKELQSAEAPVSVQRGSIGSAQVDAHEPHGLAIPVTDNGFSCSTTDESGLQRPSHDFNMPSNHRQYAELNRAENLVGFDNFPVEINSSKLHTEAVPKHGGLDEFQLPEEDNLISLGDTKDCQMPTGNSINNSHLSSNTPTNIVEKLAALGAVKDEWGMERSENLPLAHESYKKMEPVIQHHNLQVRQSSPPFQPAQMTQMNPLYPHLESHPARMSSRTNFFSPEPTFNHDSPANHQFSSSMIRAPLHRPNVRVARFDVPYQHSMLHQMQISDNHLPHMLPDSPRGGPISHHGNPATGFVQEMNQMQGFALGPRQPNIGAHGVPIPGNPPEAVQRLIEMERRAKSKQIHPFAPGHGQGMYGHEVDMGFQYR